jgi:hypothetical protein
LVIKAPIKENAPGLWQGASATLKGFGREAVLTLFLLLLGAVIYFHSGEIITGFKRDCYNQGLKSNCGNAVKI